MGGGHVRLVKCVLLAFAATVVVSSVTGCGVLSDNVQVRKTVADTNSVTITLDAVTSENYASYELDEYGLAYSTNSENLSGIATGQSKYTPQQNYPRAQVQTILVRPASEHGPRDLATLSITLYDLQPGTTYYFVPY